MTTAQRVAAQRVADEVADEINLRLRQPHRRITVSRETMRLIEVGMAEYTRMFGGHLTIEGYLQSAVRRATEEDRLAADDFGIEDEDGERCE